MGQNQSSDSPNDQKAKAGRKRLSLSKNPSVTSVPGICSQEVEDKDISSKTTSMGKKRVPQTPKFFSKPKKKESNKEEINFRTLPGLSSKDKDNSSFDKKTLVQKYTLPFRPKQMLNSSSDYTLQNKCNNQPDILQSAMSTPVLNECTKIPTARRMLKMGVSSLNRSLAEVNDESSSRTSLIAVGGMVKIPSEGVQICFQVCQYDIRPYAEATESFCPNSSAYSITEILQTGVKMSVSTKSNPKFFLTALQRVSVGLCKTVDLQKIDELPIAQALSNVLESVGFVCVDRVAICYHCCAAAVPTIAVSAENVLSSHSITEIEYERFVAIESDLNNEFLDFVLLYREFNSPILGLSYTLISTDFALAVETKDNFDFDIFEKLKHHRLSVSDTSSVIEITENVTAEETVSLKLLLKDVDIDETIDLDLKEDSTDSMDSISGSDEPEDITSLSNRTRKDMLGMSCDLMNRANEPKESNAKDTWMRCVQIVRRSSVDVNQQRQLLESRGGCVSISSHRDQGFRKWVEHERVEPDECLRRNSLKSQEDSSDGEFKRQTLLPDIVIDHMNDKDSDTDSVLSLIMECSVEDENFSSINDDYDNNKGTCMNTNKRNVCSLVRPRYRSISINSYMKKDAAIDTSSLTNDEDWVLCLEELSSSEDECYNNDTNNLRRIF
ncbi:unnamed protein product [Dimorphilus gyrociliatus]|uniref:Uncharacterized protein n=1 Tax=Dimorphilus gyrociliatus TaxID=2664684 RepID=A0A7I8W8A6_9ANNE|nr:unnamed protein product [Dimorphilus gyrociliatus]